MDFKIAFFLCSFGLNAQSVDCRFVPIDNMCETGQYCVNIEVSSDDGADFLGNSSIRFSYNTAVVSFLGNSSESITIGSYTSLNFDNDQTSLSPSCAELGGTPYTAHSFDGYVAGNFICNYLLLQSTVFGTPSACPAINEGEWVKVNEICFDVLDPGGDPNFVFAGTENGSVEDLTGTNFRDHFDPPTIYENGSFEDLHTPFSELCEGVEPIVTDPPTDEETGETEPEGISSSVDCRFVPTDNICATGEYCVNIEVSSDDGTDFLGSSSIRFDFDDEVLKFEGSSIDGINYGTYASINFDNDQSTLSAGCESVGGTPYGEHSFYSLGAGEFLLTFVLLQVTLFDTPSACPAINEGEWVGVAEICFDVLDPDGDPDFVFAGTENGQVEDLTGTNFNNHFDPPVKYENGSFESLHTSFNELCESSLVAVANENFYEQVLEALSNSRIGFGVGKTELDNIEIQVSPIPTKDMLNISYEGTAAENMTLLIYDVTGKLIMQKEHISDEGINRLSIDLSREAAGLYLLQLNNGTKRKIINIIKK